ncbi:porin [Paraburkholderia unamae]|uniref:Porin n=1 Tax=Paraburkholderia unamae TaxID=219649 RepID=A0ABX5KR65_9BURK|nr:putative porin [Paraburkholderia unamae]
MRTSLASRGALRGAAAAAFIAFSTFSGAAHAQSSVTLYGTIDTALVYANNAGGKHQVEMNSSNVLGNRWGLRGQEDLGGGLAALFLLENGYSSNTGGFQQGGDLFGRQAYMGLASKEAGTLTLGRQYDSVVDFITPLIAGAQWATYLGGHPGDLDNTNNDYRSNNSVKYTSPTWKGLRMNALYSFGGVAGQFGRNAIWSMGAGYTSGPLTLGAAYVHVKDPNFSYFGNNANSSATGNNMAASHVYSGYASAGNEQIVAVGGYYVIGRATLGAVYTNTQFRDLGAHESLNPLGYSGAAKFHNAEVNARYFVTPALLLGAAYDYTHGYGVNRVNYQQGDLGATWILSKRTQVYLVGLYQHASGTDSTGQPAVANLNGLSASSSPNQVAVLTGITHRF